MKLKQETVWTYRQLAETDLAFFMDMPADIFSKTHVYISESNTKTGNTPSVSLLPIETCGNCDGCAQYCYAVRMALRFPAVRMSWARNTAILRREPARFWAEVRQYIERKQPPAFRFNVGGEISDLSYLHDMNTTARMFPSVRFWTYQSCSLSGCNAESVTSTACRSSVSFHPALRSPPARMYAEVTAEHALTGGQVARTGRVAL